VSDGSIKLQIWVDAPYPDAKFAVICDRPCKAVDSSIDWAGRVPAVQIGPEIEMGMVGKAGERPDTVALIVDHPAVLGTDISVKCTIRSVDGLPFDVTDVKTLTIKPVD
jgi:hypothetical protein